MDSALGQARGWNVIGEFFFILKELKFASLSELTPSKKEIV
jgi:hypothetical protein